jgi:hypothetical protein
MILLNLVTYAVFKIVIHYNKQNNIKITGKKMVKIVLKTAMNLKKIMTASYSIKKLGGKCHTIYIPLFMKGIKCKSLCYLIPIKN